MVYDDFDQQAFSVYQTYVALKQHFTLDNYDFFRYNGKVRAKFDSFKTRRDKFSFVKLSKMRDYEGILIANLSRNPQKWIGDIVDESDGMTVYRQWVKITSAIEYNFQSEIKHLNDVSFESNFRVTNGNKPLVLSLYLSKKISLETFSILLDISKVGHYWLDTISDPVLTPKVIKMAEKYHPFLKYDKNKIMLTLENYFD